MGVSPFQAQIAADIHSVFLNPLEFAGKHKIDGKEMDVLVDDNELLDRDVSKGGVHQDGTYRARRLIYVACVDFGQRPGLGRSLNLDGKDYRIEDCSEENGIFAIELKAVRT